MLQNQLVRYLMVGGLNTAFGYGVYALLIWAGAHYTVATLVSTVAGILFNFKTYGALVFKNKSNRIILNFLAVYGLLYLCGNLWIFFFQKAGIHPYASGACWLIPNALLGFVLNRRFVYKKKQAKS
ncbi:MAG: GtrA family protein [Prevotellaceae bacterium]|jgi:putative flippase GtrA|nr:GtrA family protein [Prevotellaceae bacterium]